MLALRDQGLRKFSLPVVTIVFVTLLAIVLGIIAAIIPARRATKVSVVEGISTT
jgi:putative ABC transport system permease protein